MTSTGKNIVAGVLAVAAILGVAALFVNVTRSRGNREGEVEVEEKRAIWGRSLEDRSRGSSEGEVEEEEEEEERAIWGRSLEEREVPQVESNDNNEGLVEKGLVKGPAAGDRISPNEIHGHERQLWVRYDIEPPDERRAPQS